MDIDDKNNPFESQIKEIEEWQKNANNPRYYTGTGKIPIPLKNMFKAPLTILIVGLIILLFSVLNVIANFSVDNVVGQSVPIIIGIGMTSGGIIRLIRRY